MLFDLETLLTMWSSKETFFQKERLVLVLSEDVETLIVMWSWEEILFQVMISGMMKMKEDPVLLLLLSQQELKVLMMMRKMMEEELETRSESISESSETVEG